MATSTPDAVRAIAAPAVESAGLVLEDVTVTPAGRRRVLRVTVDLPEDALGGVPVESVESAARALSAALDESDVMGGMPYVLEVSSPGVDRPLRERRHWLRARGRLVTVRRSEGGSVTGRLVAVDDDGVTLDVEGATVTVAWEVVRGGRVEVEFSRLEEADLGDDGSDDGSDEDDEDDDGDDGREA